MATIGSLQFDLNRTISKPVALKWRKASDLLAEQISLKNKAIRSFRTLNSKLGPFRRTLLTLNSKNFYLCKASFSVKKDGCFELTRKPFYSIIESRFETLEA